MDKQELIEKLKEIEEKFFEVATTGWINNNRELASRAILDGYEIEKEPRWVVKTSEEVWVNDITTNLCNSKVVDFCDDKRPALVFLDKKIAEAVALLVDGSVEEV